AVIDGTLPEERLTEAAANSARVGASAVTETFASSRAAAPLSEREIVQIARRATSTVGDLQPLEAPVQILRCSETPNIAVGVVPWGPATVLNTATTTETVLSRDSQLETDRIQQSGTVLIVTRDRHRYAWMRD